MSAIRMLSSFTATVSAFPAPHKKHVYEGRGNGDCSQIAGPKKMPFRTLGETFQKRVGQCQK